MNRSHCLLSPLFLPVGMCRKEREQKKKKTSYAAYAMASCDALESFILYIPAPRLDLSRVFFVQTRTAGLPRRSKAVDLRLGWNVRGTGRPDGLGGRGGWVVAGQG